MSKELEECSICPHKCSINRNKGKVGRCKATDKVKIHSVTDKDYENTQRF